MSTKHELKSQAAKLQAELAKLNKTIASMKDELPEGFTPFEATADSKCPCHEKDIVLWVTGYYPNGIETKYQKEAGGLVWTNSETKNNRITGYKIVKKYVEPRPMKFSEIPVGQVFRWSFSKNKSTAERGAFMKINSSQRNSFGEVVNCVALSGSDKGRVTLFRDGDGVFFFESSFDGEIGELLMAK